MMHVIIWNLPLILICCIALYSSFLLIVLLRLVKLRSLLSVGAKLISVNYFKIYHVLIWHVLVRAIPYNALYVVRLMQMTNLHGDIQIRNTIASLYVLPFELSELIELIAVASDLLFPVNNCLALKFIYFYSHLRLFMHWMHFGNMATQIFAFGEIHWFATEIDWNDACLHMIYPNPHWCGRPVLSWCCVCSLWVCISADISPHNIHVWLRAVSFLFELLDDDVWRVDERDISPE